VIDTKLNHLEAGLKDLSSKVEKKFDRTDRKIDRFVHFFLDGLVLVGEFYFLLKDVQK
jgi:hypothetical protein